MTSPGEGTRLYEVWVCPECGQWHPDTARGWPLYSGCEPQGHPQAECVTLIPRSHADRLEEALRERTAAGDAMQVAIQRGWADFIQREKAEAWAALQPEEPEG